MKVYLAIGGAGDDYDTLGVFATQELALTHPRCQTVDEYEVLDRSPRTWTVYTRTACVTPQLTLDDSFEDEAQWTEGDIGWDGVVAQQPPTLRTFLERMGTGTYIQVVGTDKQTVSDAFVQEVSKVGASDPNRA